MSIILNGTTGITTPDVTSDGSLKIDASAPDDSLVVNASGNVGIGISYGLSRLTVAGHASGADGAYATGRGSIVLNEKNRTSVNDAGGFEFKASVYGSGYGAKIMALDNGTLVFGNRENSATYSERARIDSKGNLMVGTTSVIALGKQSISYSGLSQRGISIQTTSSDGYAIGFVNSSGTIVGNIYQAASSTAYNTSSDYRLKEDWVTVADASTRVNALKPVNFAWKADGKRVDGFLAHELAEVVPEAVTGEKDAVELVDITDEEGNVTGQEERPVYQGIDQSKLVPLLTAALQEALAEINDLKARVSALEAA